MDTKTPNAKEGRHQGFWLWERSGEEIVGHLTGIAAMILTAVSLSEYKDIWFPQARWLAWLLFF